MPKHGMEMCLLGLLCLQEFEVARSWGSSLPGKLPTWHRCPGGFREVLGALRAVTCPISGMLEVLGLCCPGF